MLNPKKIHELVWNWHICGNINFSAKSSQIFMKLSAYVKISLLSWLIMFMGMHECPCMHSTWKYACNFGQWSNHYISAEWSKIFMKLGKITMEVWRMPLKKGSDTYMHASAMHMNMHVCFYIWLLIFNSAKLGGDKKIKVSQESPMYSHNNVHACECN